MNWLTSYIASWEIRDGDITREEGLALSKKYDLEFPARFAQDLYNYVSIPKEEYPVASKNFEEPIFDQKYFLNLHDKFRSPHLWKKDNNIWSLRNVAWDDAEKSNVLTTNQDQSAFKWQGNKKYLMKSFKIGNVTVGDNYPPVIIVELGINHNGNLDMAIEMVDKAIDAGATIIKHQTHIVEDEMSYEAKKIIPANSNKTIFDIIKKCALIEKDEKKLMNHIKSRKIFISTPFS